MGGKGRAGRGSGRAYRPPTINDVARHAGVSPTTVSRVINGENTVRGAKRTAVLSAVEALSFKPNVAARRLAGSAPLRIGLLYGNPSASYLSEFLVGSLEAASRLGVQLLVERCELGDGAIVAARRLMDGGVDGMMLTPPLGDLPGLVDAVVSGGGLLTIVGSSRPAEGLPAVGIDDAAAAAAMTQHLIALGHRRIGFVTGAMDVSVSGDRLAGYRQALREGGIVPDDTLVVGGDYTYRSGLEGARRLLDLAVPPTAIFASNDDMAAATAAEAQRRGMAVPGALSVCGFDDAALATAIWPELTTIRQPIADMARQGMTMLVDAIRQSDQEGEPQAQHRLLAFELIRRGSDTVPPS
ncbi:transcriptional regulator, LacI family [Sphingomonas gellani]|uniref:Transcriptional regulator, LacI family n=1 Tax=Sphingomonas gellani TaxID=1166340 RepID=A0A1H7ZJ90_9SPHN|nr:LacI family DNA-binding transcriptional regulator [Sphingomonas gellani]SEM57559.1 transcriptional regulator, LacI family [Sphingomonas gellani]